MFRLIFSIFMIRAWWVWAILAYIFIRSALGSWETHQSNLAEAEAAIRNGPPGIVKVGEYHGHLTGQALNELHLAGIIRADLGIGSIEGSTPKTFLVLDSPDRTGPIMAVMFVGTDAQDGLSDLVATANESGLVIAQGFRRTLDRTEIADQLRGKGVSREVLVMEAMIGDRHAALREKGASHLLLVVLVGGLAVVTAFMAVYRFSQRGKTTSKRNARIQRREERRAKLAAQLEAAIPPATPVKAAPLPETDAAPATPWGGKQKPAESAQKQTSKPKRQPHEKDPVPESTSYPAFKSVFPGGSGFQFKTANEIIQQYFGVRTGFGELNNRE